MSLREYEDDSFLCERCEEWRNGECKQCEQDWMEKQPTQKARFKVHRDGLAKKARERRDRLRMAEVFERDQNGSVQFLSNSESLRLVFATETFKCSEIAWRQRTLGVVV